MVGCMSAVAARKSQRANGVYLQTCCRAEPHSFALHKYKVKCMQREVVCFETHYVRKSLCEWVWWQRQRQHFTNAVVACVFLSYFEWKETKKAHFRQINSHILCETKLVRIIFTISVRGMQTTGSTKIAFLFRRISFEMKMLAWTRLERMKSEKVWKLRPLRAYASHFIQHCVHFPITFYWNSAYKIKRNRIGIFAFRFVWTLLNHGVHGKYVCMYYLFRRKRRHPFQTDETININI